MKLNLGILLYDGKVVNHRSLLKVVFNPIFRYFGFCIASRFTDTEFQGYTFIKQKRSRSIKYSLKSNDFDEIIKKHRII